MKKQMFSGGIRIVLFLLMVVFFKIESTTYLITFAILQIAFMPVIYRLSRLIWINIFVNYKKEI